MQDTVFSDLARIFFSLTSHITARSGQKKISQLAGKDHPYYLQQRWFSAGFLLINACTYFRSSVTGFSYIVISEGGHEL